MVGVLCVELCIGVWSGGFVGDFVRQWYGVWCTEWATGNFGNVCRQKYEGMYNVGFDGIEVTSRLVCWGGNVVCNSDLGVWLNLGTGVDSGRLWAVSMAGFWVDIVDAELMLMAG